MGRKIAIIEDEEAIRENYAVAFRRQGYDVLTYADRPGALQAFEERLPDLAIVDIGLGDEVEGGFDLCRQLRGISAGLPIIFLTARDSDLDTISGLRLGADDYLSKSVSLPHLLARVAALLRRVEALKSPLDATQVLERGHLLLDLDRMSVVWRGTALQLTVTEYWIVHALVRFPGHVKTRDQLMQEANVVVDDYLSKSVSLPHLLARVAALLRRVEALKSPLDATRVLERGHLLLDLDRMSVVWRGTALQLTVTEYWIVHALVRFPGHVKTRDQLMQEANVVVDDSTITSHIKRVRKKFQAIDADFDCIDTVYAMGYRWTCAA